MITLEGLQTGIAGIGEDVKQFVSEKPVVSAGIGVGVLGATALGVAGVVKAKKGTVKRKKTVKKTQKGRIRDRKFRSKQKHELSYVRRKRKLKKKITRPTYKRKSVKTTKKRVGKVYYTKKGQPYKIMSSGKAKFIKGKRG